MTGYNNLSTRDLVCVCVRESQMINKARYFEYTQQKQFAARPSRLHYMLAYIQQTEPVPLRYILDPKIYANKNRRC